MLLKTFFLLVAVPVAGQTPVADSLFTQQAKQQAVRTYEQTMAKQEHVYGGNEYISHDHRIQVHPYFPTDSLLDGTIAYKDAQYHDVKMLYDVVRDEVVIQPPEGGYRLRLEQNRISQFSIGDHRFRRVVSDSTLRLPTGFYEVLYGGRSNVWAHRAKVVHEDISSGAYKADYLVKDRFYVQKAGAYYEVKTKRSVLTLFPDQAKALRRFIRANHLKFTNEERQAALTQLVQRYDELTR